MKPVQVITIGRSQKNDIVINDEKASRIHCQIMRYDDGKYGIVDFNSTNGTYVNEFRINGEHILNPYDVVRIGSTSLPWRDMLEKRGKKVPHQQPTTVYGSGNRNSTKIQRGSSTYGGTNYNGSMTQGGTAYGSGTAYGGTAYGGGTNYTDTESDTAGIISLILGIISVLTVLLIVILFFTADFGKAAQLLGVNVIKFFPLYLHGISFSTGKWLFIIIALLTGTAADFVTIFSNRSHSSTESWGLTLANIGVTVGFVFLLLAIFAEQLTKGMIQMNLF